MAATDAFYRNQKTLHIVFAVSSIVMLATIVAMFVEDYNREWKTEQRIFRDVEEEMTKRRVLENAPAEAKIGEIVRAERTLAVQKKELADAKAALEKQHGKLISEKLQTETKRAEAKAEFDSRTSFYNGATERGDFGAAEKFKQEVEQLKSKLDELTVQVEKLQADYDKEAREFGIAAKEEAVKKAEEEHKKLVADFDRFAKLASQKKWRTWKDGLLNMPVIDGFASPTKIQQYTLDELPIDYSFKYVTRFDRCTTCHLGLEKAGYSKDVLRELTDDPNQNRAIAVGFKTVERLLKYRDPDAIDDLRRELEREKEKAQRVNDAARVSQIEAQIADLPDPNTLTFLNLNLPDADTIRPRQIPADRLTEGRVNQFCEHPRLELFVDGNSPHSAQRFGCTICHSGQGSATRFYEASHSPNDAAAKKRWQDQYQWKSNHYWDFPMLPTRFVESSCVKCHHQITDVIRDGVRNEAPKLVKGYNLVRELGCFGCHEIAGVKGGRKVGPDLRLEDEVPLEALSPAERLKKTSDPLNPPGTMRKVGPSTYRLAEKTNETWLTAWIKSPRGFRPDTRMPHFYLQPNNDPSQLPSDQKAFPDAEIQAVAHYLMTKSRQFVGDVDAYHSLKAKANASAEEKSRLAAMENRLELRQSSPPVGKLELPKSAAKPDVGRMLFSEKGCIACHVHEGTGTEARTSDNKPLPAIMGESNFGPNLTRVAAKLGTQFGKPETAKQWLVSWLLNPTGHSPRTLMPQTHLTVDEAAEIASWLLSHPSDWKPIELAPAGMETLKAMAKVYLEKVLTRSEVRTVLESGLNKEQFARLAADADERELGEGPLTDDRLKMYVGKKAIGNLGCYACHNIPGFQTAKPIGTALNEWGKKDVERIAFEDADRYVKEHYSIVELRDDPKDKTKPHEDWSRAVHAGKRPYEKYFADMLEHHRRSREGFLHLKLADPRSYDHNRLRTWDERLRMPQFKFARTQRQANESEQAFAARAAKEEAEAREAVMTFILGLVAEPVPPKFVYNPPPERQAEIRGRQVLEKYNCAACHIVRSGIAEVKTPNLKEFDDKSMVRKEEGRYSGDDYILNEHVAWTGLPQPRSDRWTLRHVRPPIAENPDDDDPKENLANFWLMQALQYKNDGKTRHYPAGGATLELDRSLVLASHEQYGGTFMASLAKYLRRKDRQNYGGSNISYAYAAGPPTLIGEGEKVQPDWLYQFLLNPYPIRPLTVLRMPKFNMSPDEAQALVSYFAAVDKVRNPGIGLTYPYASVPQRDEAYLLQKNADYVSRLKAQGKFEERKKQLQDFWQRESARLVSEAEKRAQDAAQALAKAPEAEKDAARQAKEAADKLVQHLKANALKELERRWEEREAYIADAWRLVVNNALCLTCHTAGMEPPKENKGPNLNDAWKRLRPDWTQRWVTNPNRFLHYISVMPINFKANATDPKELYLELFNGTPDEQIAAVRDFLMAYPLVKDWPILRGREIPGGTGPPMPAAKE